MRNKKNLIILIVFLIISICVGISSSASLAYFNNVKNQKINTLEIRYNK